jgi:hypothetical protein
MRQWLLLSLDIGRLSGTPTGSPPKTLSPIAHTMLEMTKGAVQCNDGRGGSTSSVTSASLSSSSSTTPTTQSAREARDDTEYNQYHAMEEIEIGFEDCLRQDYQLYRV